MPFITPSFDTIRDDLLRDIRNQLPDAATGSDSDYFARASSVASVAEGLYNHQTWITRQIFPDTADTEYLELHCRLRNIFRKPATTASGTVTMTAEPGATAPAGLMVKRDDRTWTTTEQAAAGVDGKATARAYASVPGVAGNTTAAMSAMLVSAPTKFDSAVTVSEMRGGTEAESDASLLERLLEAIRRPAAGGNKYDYKRWALSVPGVTEAFVYPLRRGLGTVDVVIVAGDGLPSDDTIKATQDYIDDLRPVTAKNCLVIAPAIVSVNVSLQVWLKGLSVDEARRQISATVATWFSYLAPGETAVLSDLGSLIKAITGIWDYRFVTPTGNVVPVSDASRVEWLRPGTLTVEQGV